MPVSGKEGEKLTANVIDIDDDIATAAIVIAQGD